MVRQLNRHFFTWKLPFQFLHLLIFHNSITNINFEFNSRTSDIIVKTKKKGS